MASKSRWKSFFITIGVLIFLVMGNPTLAKEKKNPLILMGFGVGLRETYDNNVFQTNAFEDSDLVSEITPGASIDLSIIRWLNLGASYQTKIYYYLNHSELNKIFHDLDLNIGIDLGFIKSKRWRNFRLSTEVDLSPVMLSVTKSGDTGFNSVQRVLLGVIPGYLWPLNAKTSLDFEAHLQRIIFFDEGENSNIGDLIINFKRTLFRRYVFTMGAQATVQDFDDLGTTLIFGGNLGFEFEIIKRLTGMISGGYRIIDLPSAGSSAAITLSANLEYALSKRTHLVLTASRANSVDINNLDFTELFFLFEVNHRLSALSVLGLMLSYRLADQDALIDMVLLNDDLTSYGAALRWQFTKFWTFALRANRDQNRGADFSNDYDQNRLSLEVRFNFPVSIH